MSERVTFDLTVLQLKQLSELRGNDLIEKLNGSEFQGIDGILKKLKVDPDAGLDSNNENDLGERRRIFGKNEIPPKPMRTFLGLCWDALHDMLLVILLVCALISIGLSFYQPPTTGNEHHEERECENGFPNRFKFFHIVSSESKCFVFCSRENSSFDSRES